MVDLTATIANDSVFCSGYSTFDMVNGSFLGYSRSGSFSRFYMFSNSTRPMFNLRSTGLVIKQHTRLLIRVTAKLDSQFLVDDPAD